MNEAFPISAAKAVHHNLLVPVLLQLSLCQDLGRLTAGGALAVETGQHTGRSAKDKFVVLDKGTKDTVWWDNSPSITPEQFANLREDFLVHAADRELYVHDLYGGADPKHRLQTRIITELPWHGIFIRHLLRRPPREDLTGFNPEFTVVNFPSFRADPSRHGGRSETLIACNFTDHLVLIAGTSYAGETKKSVFTYLNYILPEKDVMPMHCSANVGDDGDSAIFFGLSGTGKTTLSADPNRTLIGDDEHGWSDNGIFNFEGGCYAKTIKLSKEAEPEIYDASQRFATILENVILNDDLTPDFDDGKLTENTRSAYPLEYIANASETGIADHPKNIVMLTADAFGVLPPIAKLSPSQAMYHFLSGYTAKVAGTEKGVSNDPQATFSTCFGAPFMPRHPAVYGNLLRKLIAKHDTDCWLVNTGWTGGQYGDGSRMPIKATRTLLNEALSGKLNSVEMRTDPIFGFAVPVSVEGVDSKILNPRSTWADAAEYDKKAKALVGMFAENFTQYADHVDDEVRAAGPSSIKEKA